MMRRRMMLAAPAVLSGAMLAGCGLSERPYEERRQWPIAVRRPQALTARRGAPVLLLRTLRAGPGLEQRGLQSLQADGSMKVSFYEEWLVPPAQGVEEALRRWLADSGLYSAVTAPGSRIETDLVMEGELTALWTVPATRQGHATLGVAVARERGASSQVVLQRAVSAEAPMAGDGAREAVAAQTDALAEVFTRIESGLRGM